MFAKIRRLCDNTLGDYSMKKHLIALDLDGTLLYDWDTLLPRTVDYLKALKNQGHTLVIATGRPYRSSEPFYRMLDLDTPMINYNGGLISWRNNPDFEEVGHYVNRDMILAIFEANRAFIDNAFCEIKDDIYLLEKREDIMGLLHYFNGAKLHVGPFDETLPSDPHGFIVVAHKHQGQHIEAYVKKHYKNDILVRNWGDEYRFIIELYTPKTNKGKALAYVAEVLGHTQDEVIAFGDGHNDIEMLRWAGLGVAMKNAHEGLFEVADVISPYTNRQHAIERFLRHRFEQKK